MAKNYLDGWIAKKIEADTVTRDNLERYQLFKLRETMNYAKNNSRYYREHLKDFDPDRDLESLDDLAKVPFTSDRDLRENSMQMVCVPQGEISRIVTLDTSGSTGEPKRVFFIEDDQELTVDFFHNGMQNLVDRNDTVLILFPCERSGSIGTLLQEGLERIGCKVIPHGLIRDYREVSGILEDERVTAIVGMPSQVARLSDRTLGVKKQIRSVLLSAEYVSPFDASTIEENWRSKVYEHYGMTEMGLGGAVSCYALEGYHPRENDILFEIIDKAGNVITDDSWGELVFTTLTRKGMPFIRYRTGDISRWLLEPCKCGSILKRIDRVKDRRIAKGAFVNPGDR